MATKQSIEFTINEDGSIEVHPVGFKGKKCTEVTKEIIEALGIVKNTNYTSEYYQQETETHTTVSVGGDGDNK
jgi:hypothetical protein